MFRTETIFPNGQGFHKILFCHLKLPLLTVPALNLVQGGRCKKVKDLIHIAQIVEYNRDVGVIFAKQLLADRQRMPKVRLTFSVT